MNSGMVYLERWFPVPVLKVFTPVIMVVLLGEHTVPVEKAFLKTTPSPANLSMLGVLASLFPYAPINSGEVSSIVIHRIFGFS